MRNSQLIVIPLAVLAACGGRMDDGPTTEDTTAVVPVSETAPVTTPPADTTMAAPVTSPMDTMAVGDPDALPYPPDESDKLPSRPSGGQSPRR